jgi:hypothetical protein
MAHIASEGKCDCLVFYTQAIKYFDLRILVSKSHVNLSNCLSRSNENDVFWGLICPREGAILLNGFRYACGNRAVNFSTIVLYRFLLKVKPRLGNDKCSTVPASFSRSLFCFATPTSYDFIF